MEDKDIKEIQRKINRAANGVFSLNSKKLITSVYGGQTIQTVNKRLEQHIKEDSKFNGMKKFELTSLNIYDPELAKEAEQYLINLLDTKFQTKCINARNEDGSISQMGGVGESNKHTLHQLYILVKEQELIFV